MLLESPLMFTWPIQFHLLLVGQNELELTAVLCTVSSVFRSSSQITQTLEADFLRDLHFYNAHVFGVKI